MNILHTKPIDPQFWNKSTEFQTFQTFFLIRIQITMCLIQNFQEVY